MTEELVATRVDERDPVPPEEDADRAQVTIDEALGEPTDDESEDDVEGDEDEGGEA